MKKLITGIIASVVIVVALGLGIGVGLKKAVGKNIDTHNMLAVVGTNYKNYMSYYDYDGDIPSGTGDFFIFNAKYNGSNSNRAYNGLNTKIYISSNYMYSFYIVNSKQGWDSGDIIYKYELDLYYKTT